jgi:hypothetical protein
MIFKQKLEVKVGNRQTLETLITEEALLLEKFLRNEQNAWAPRIPHSFGV